MSSAAIRAGKAFVEMLVNDDTVPASLANVQAKFAAFSTAMQAGGAAAFAGYGAVATTAIVGTAVQLPVLTAGLKAVDAVVGMVANTVRVTFNYITTSVFKAIAAVSTLAVLLRKFLPANSKITTWFNSFLDQSGVMTQVGGWARFIGKVTGNQLLFALGNQTQRLGLGAAIVKGFNTGGFVGLMKSSLGAAFISVKSMIGDRLGGLLAMPLRATKGIAGLFGGSRGAANAMSSITGSASGAASALTRASVASRALGATQAALHGIGSALKTVALRGGLMAAALTGPALAAAKGFVTAAADIIAKAKETGQSIASLIAEKYGSAGLISVGDIEAGAALSATMKELKQAMAASWAQIGVAALPVLRSMTETTLLAARAVGLFLSENRPLVGQVIAIAAKVGSLSAAALGLHYAFLALGPVMAMVMSPIGLMAAGVIALALAFPTLRTEASNVFSYLTSGFEGAFETVKQTMQGIGDAISGGSLQAAARVLWAGINLVWLEGTESIRSVFREASTSLVRTWVNVGSSLHSAWIVITRLIGDAWAALVNGMGAVWKTAQNGIAGGFARVIAKATGQDVNEVLATLSEMQNADAKASQDSIAAADKSREESAAKRLKEIEEQRLMMLESVDEEAEARAGLADKALKDARAEFAAARDAAAALKAPKAPALSEAEKLGVAATTLGSFSTSAVNRQSVGGIGDIKKAMDETARNTGETVAAVKSMQLNWA